MKILLSVCGFGNGHSAREADVLAALLQRGHQVVLMGFLNSARYFQEHFPQIPMCQVRVPIIHVSAQTGIDFAKTATEPFNRFEDGHSLNFGAMGQVLEHFGGLPDLVISDYELVAAQLAYALELPLVTLDQQSKFAGFQFPEIKGFSRLEEKSRLSMFFPRAEVRYACSFFELKHPRDPRFEVQLIPPILRQEVLKHSPATGLTHSNQVVVYFSPHGQLQQTPEELYAVFQQVPDKQFIIYTRHSRPNIANLEFRSFDTHSFFQALESAEAIITTAGHNLLSELAYLKKPAYILPFPTFDQQCCAQVIAENQLGVAAEIITQHTLEAFFRQLEQYQANLLHNQGLVTRFDGLTVLLDDLHRRFGV